MILDGIVDILGVVFGVMCIIIQCVSVFSYGIWVMKYMILETSLDGSKNCIEKDMNNAISARPAPLELLRSRSST